MVPEFRLPEEGSQRSCSWCGDVLGESLLPPEVAALFDFLSLSPTKKVDAELARQLR